ncbi:carboxymuconolactone decarboxylase family protein [Acidimangrovimonas pyrenivorans]|uniref:Carboxymuconolactone decarboxylase family protein n=1 Tax=Acidimangrovimonas pyrenivorans TaxID=2030798 RepID=A0ABV7AEL8_9RHOB
MTAPLDLPPLADADWPEEAAALRAGFAGRLNVYRVMAHHPALLKSWQTFRNHVVRETSLGAARSEVAILRTGVRLEAPYEWAHHVVRGRDAGLSDARIRSLRGPLSGMSAEDAAIARAVDELIDDACLSAGAQAELAALVGVAGVFDVIATVGHYRVLACILKSFGTPIDDDIAAALAAQPID